MLKKIKDCTYNQLYYYNRTTPHNENVLCTALKFYLEFYPNYDGIKIANAKIKEFMSELNPKFTNIIIEV